MTVDEWNRWHPTGTRVRFWIGLRKGDGTKSKTRSEAWDLCGSPVVMIEGASGGIGLTHVEVLSELGETSGRP